MTGATSSSSFAIYRSTRSESRTPTPTSASRQARRPSPQGRASRGRTSARTCCIEPLGMTSTSSRFDDYRTRTEPRARATSTSTASTHPHYVRDPQPEAPAGGVSTSVNDMTHWLTMVLADGSYDGKQIVDSKAAAARGDSADRVQPGQSNPRCARASTVTGSTSAPRRRRACSSAIRARSSSGAGTNFVILPSADVAIVALTNATPSGVPEALTAQFADLVQFGEVREDWCALYQRRLHADGGAGRLARRAAAAREPRARPRRWRATSATTPTRTGDRRGSPRRTASCSSRSGTKLAVPLKHWDGNVFTFEIGHARIRRPGQISQGDVRREQADAGVLRRGRARGPSPDEPARGQSPPGLSDAEVAQRVADGQDQRRPDPGRAQRLGDRARQRLHPDQRDPRRAAGHRAVDRIGHQRAVRAADRRQQRDRHHPGAARQADARQARDRRAGETDGAQASPGRARGRPTRSCSTTSSNSVPATRSSSTATSSRRPNLEVDESLLTGEADPIAKDVGDKVDVGQLRGRGQRRLPRHQGRPRGVRRQARRGGQQVHAGEIRTAQRHQQDPAVHHLPAGPRRAADHLHAAVHHRRRAGGSRCCAWSVRWCRWCPRAWC